ncbi:Cdc15p [Fusarium mundagurra]|uniref:non-specific serine/threonine protein kinase n=1 Tax=Fusarium mundagurra TaxID=1567541 RepID=A0A8H5Z6J4_9HYPO|nr:Cdc15p [Fusarium mundagurra]
MPREWNSILNELEFIPMSELITDGDLAQNPVTSWRPSKACPWDHHLFTEEEVLKFCVEAKFEFPGYRGENGIVFEATELGEGELCKARQDLHVVWVFLKNDCGFTFDPATKRTYLLQTRPGIMFRELQKRFSLDAARKYFRSVTDQQRLNRHKTFDSVLDGMQLQNSKIQAYGGLVDVIPFDEISLTGEADDTGHSGTIPFGSWHVPQGARLHRPDSEAIPVALKLVWRPGDPNLELFKRELASSIATFTDSPIASIRLNGLTIDPDSREIFLVFERARSVPLFLEQSLVNTGKDWDLISELLRDAADSLEVIHKRGYLHRDIHMGNVLIHTVPCPNDPFEPFYTELVIIDLGQGQDMSNSAWITSNYYGDRNYWAPEVKLGRCYSEKSDIFALGYLMAEILSIRCGKANNEKIPKVLWDLIATCLRKDPDQRPKAYELATQAQKLRDDFFVVPESRSTVMRGEVVLNGPYVDFLRVFNELKQSLSENDKDESGNLVPDF